MNQNFEILGQNFELSDMINNSMPSVAEETTEF